VLRREADRLADLMRDLLDYGKPPRLERAATDCDAVVDEAIRACEPLARSLGGQVVREGNWAGRQACIDRWRVTQCLQNLVQNALQHAPAGTPVVVGSALVIDDGREWVTCSVRDRGPGIPPDDLPRLFEPFFSRRSGGTGLGLSIALRVASQHGGRLEAYNHPSGGAVTRLILPVSAPAQNA
jgi:signal transduction histidine kinase